MELSGAGNATADAVNGKWCRREGGRVVDFFVLTSTAHGLTASLHEGENAPKYGEGFGMLKNNNLSLAIFLFNSNKFIMGFRKILVGLVPLMIRDPPRFTFSVTLNPAGRTSAGGGSWAKAMVDINNNTEETRRIGVIFRLFIRISFANRVCGISTVEK